MNVNEIFEIRVKCTNANLMDYINTALEYGVEIIPGLQFCGMVENNNQINKKIETIKPEEKTQFVKPTAYHNDNIKQPKYNGGWVDTENKSAMQDMFDSFRI